jgi:hypothetical protein
MRFAPNTAVSVNDEFIVHLKHEFRAGRSARSRASMRISACNIAASRAAKIGQSPAQRPLETGAGNAHA